MNILVLQLLSHGSINCGFQKIIAFEGHTSNVSAFARYPNTFHFFVSCCIGVSGCLRRSLSSRLVFGQAHEDFTSDRYQNFSGAMTL